jgi:hypothetical protein
MLPRRPAPDMTCLGLGGLRVRRQLDAEPEEPDRDQRSARSPSGGWQAMGGRIRPRHTPPRQRDPGGGWHAMGGGIRLRPTPTRQRDPAGGLRQTGSGTHRGSRHGSRRFRSLTRSPWGLGACRSSSSSWRPSTSRIPRVTARGTVSPSSNRVRSSSWRSPRHHALPGSFWQPDLSVALHVATDHRKS